MFLHYFGITFSGIMEQFQSLLPEGKSISCLEDLSVLTVKDLKKILDAYKDELSGIKADLVLRVYAIFSRPSILVCFTYTVTISNGRWSIY